MTNNICELTTIKLSQTILQELNYKSWKHNNKRWKNKNSFHYSLYQNEERALSYIHEEDNHLIITYPIFSQALSTNVPLLQDMIPTNLSSIFNYFPIITKYDPFESSTNLSHSLDNICQPNPPWFSPWIIISLIWWRTYLRILVELILHIFPTHHKTHIFLRYI